MRILASLVVLGTLVVCLLRIFDQGYVPRGVGLTHVAKAVSGKGWREVVVIRKGLPGEPLRGWAVALRAFSTLGGLSTSALSRLVAASLLLLLGLGPILLLRRPEAWLLSLVAGVAVLPGLAPFLMSARPGLLNSVAVAGCGLLASHWRERRRPWWMIGTASLVMASTVAVGNGWYVLLLLPLVWLWHGEREIAEGLFLAAIAAILVGALVSGEPAATLAQPLVAPALALGDPRPLGVPRPEDAVPLAALVVIGVLVRRRKADDGVHHEDVLLRLAGVAWVFGFARPVLWAEWGIPAVLLWLAFTLDRQVLATSANGRRRRLFVLASIALAGVMVLGSDVSARWSTRDLTYAPLLNPLAEEALPSAGGTLYFVDNRILDQVFAARPRLPFKYLLGPAEGLLPKVDREILELVRRSSVDAGDWDWNALALWLGRLGVDDRLVLRTDQPPPFQGIQWIHAGAGIWSARRLPQGAF